MSYPSTYHFVFDRAEYERAPKGAGVAYAPALCLPDRVAPLATELEGLAASLSGVSVLRSMHAYRRIAAIRKQFDSLQPRYQSCLADCHDRLSQPVEGAPSMDNAWLQGASTAMGISALTRLTSSASGVSETLDRKSAYALASFSLYIAIVSLVATVVFGWLSLK
jgi:hypothetical protein